MSTIEANEDYAKVAFKARQVILTYDISEESLGLCLEAKPKHPATPTEGNLLMLAAAFMTVCEGLRDEQHRIRRSTDDGQLIDLDEPTKRRLGRLKIAGRQAAIAITLMEQALAMARKAEDNVRA
jgi:hypothetical protein